eukprot:gene18108-biopygen8381
MWGNAQRRRKCRISGFQPKCQEWGSAQRRQKCGISGVPPTCRMWGGALRCQKSKFPGFPPKCRLWGAQRPQTQAIPRNGCLGCAARCTAQKAGFRNSAKMSVRGGAARGAAKSAGFRESRQNVGELGVGGVCWTRSATKVGDVSRYGC